MLLDLASLASVREFVVEWKKSSYPPLKALICNAGLQVVTETTYTQDGFETTFGVNHLGHFLLANLLVPLMAADSQIVWVSSDTHDTRTNSGMPGPVYTDPKTLAFPLPYGQKVDLLFEGRKRYTTSKLCNIYTAYEMDRLLKKRNIPIRVNAFNPGLMPGSGLARDYSPIMRFAWNYVLPIIARFKKSIRSTKQSGKALASLFLDQSLLKVSGQYFDGDKQIRSSVDSYNVKNAKDLWEGSIKLTSLNNDEIW
jgi:NAD(P)-dependent dehydrogenase (short-subunit alcohol dehydrogenase family)